MKKLIMLEFNELCHPLIERFMAAGDLPNIKKLHDSSVVRKTDADASGEDLNPWVQWVDLHTGMNFKDHGLYHLNEAHKFQGKFTWDLLCEKLGVKSWICGSMNAGYQDGFKGRFLPDPWTVNVEPYPPQQMDEYYNYICQGVQGHSKSGKAEVSAGAFVKTLLKQGISASTIIKLGRQMFNEKLLGRESWERAMVLDWIQFDVFKHYYKKDAPQFSTFFSNSVAHYQHHYWRDFEPELFGDSDYTPDPVKAQAILKAYKNTDDIIGKILQMIDSDTAVLFVTALSQQPYVKNKRYSYHIATEEVFRKTFDIPASAAYKPVMAHQFHLECSSEEEAKATYERLATFQMDSDDYFHEGSRALFHTKRDEKVLDVQCRVTKDAHKEATFVDDRTGERHSFYDSFYQMDNIKSGMHNPLGLYWFRRPQVSPEVIEETCPPSQVHYDVLNFFGASQT